MRTRAAAFVDVDGTLLTGTSLFGFLAFDLAERGFPESEYQLVRKRIRTAAQQLGRVEALRTYFRAFAGRAESALAERGREWYARESRADGFYHAVMRGRLAAHRAAGHLIVLVSGSFTACLDPIAAEVDADAVLCSRPEVRDGTLTGQLPEPMVGVRKATGVLAFAKQAGVRLTTSYAYGDHISDLPMLSLAGRPVMVGTDPELAALADRGALHRLSTAERPAPVAAATAAGLSGNHVVLE